MATMEQVAGQHIRWMIRRDLDEAVEIDRQGFAEPWTESDFTDALKISSIIAKVATGPDGRVEGYLIYSLRKTSLGIIRLAVRDECRRQGVGTQMIADLRGKLSHNRRQHLKAMVRESDLRSQQFFRACGFRAIGIHYEFWINTGEDGYMMQYSLGDR